jgi:hypothetical protein
MGFGFGFGMRMRMLSGEEWKEEGRWNMIAWWAMTASQRMTARKDLLLSFEIWQVLEISVEDGMGGVLI